ncbi:MAG: hypothetical protein HY318_02660 [Armatimonadetes bacterium]|nr:hypothetical protein [Armatimonadota bacterium]
MESRSPISLLVSIVAMSCVWPAVRVSSAATVSNEHGKKLIRWAAELTQKTTAEEIPEKIGAWQDAGLDGLCLTLHSHANGSSREALLSPESIMFFRWWMKPRTRAEFAPEIAALKRVRWGRIENNFVLTAAVAYDGRPPDYVFNEGDWKTILGNARLLAGIAKEIGFKGMVFDTEQYGWAAKGRWSQPWSYAAYAAGTPDPLPFDKVAAKVRQRGKQWMRAMLTVYPDMTVLVAPGLYEVAWEGSMAAGGLAKSDYGLFPAFIDGMLLGMNDRARLVGLSERTYMMSRYCDMAAERDKAKQQALVVSTVPELAIRRTSFAAGLWTDAAYGTTGSFSNKEAGLNQRDPVRHEHAVANALAVSDGYAWLYGEASYWLQWGEASSPFNDGFTQRYVEPPALIKEYWRATVKGHEAHDLDWEPMPKHDPNNYDQFDAQSAAHNRDYWAAKEKDGYSVAAQFPQDWKFLFDVEMLGRFRSYGVLDTWYDKTWLSIDCSKCWQSQGIKANGYAFYGARVELPAGLDLIHNDVFLAFGGYGSGSVNIYVNGAWVAYIPNNAMPDVTKYLKPGQVNSVVLGFMDTTGPQGLAGNVKLLLRGKP